MTPLPTIAEVQAQYPAPISERDRDEEHAATKEFSRVHRDNSAADWP